MSTVKSLVVNWDLEFNSESVMEFEQWGSTDWLIDWLNVKNIYRYLLIDIGQIGHDLI